MPGRAGEVGVWRGGLLAAGLAGVGRRRSRRTMYQRCSGAGVGEMRGISRAAGYPLEEAPAVLQRLLDRASIGKPVIRFRA